MRTVSTFDGKGEVSGVVLLDDADYNRFGRLRWTMDRGYVRRNVQVANRITKIYLHRAILGLDVGDPRRGDHINRNRLDCRRQNLRIVPGNNENNQNVGSLPGSSSLHRGVSWDARRNKWYASAQLDGRKYGLGLYDDEEEAAQVASVWRAEHMPYSIDALLKKEAGMETFNRARGL